MPANRSPQPLLIQILDLTLIQLSNWRWSWRGMITTGILAPCLSIFALGIFARASSLQALRYVLVGNVVLSLMFQTQNQVSGNFAYMRAMGTFSYFATLPIQRAALILGTVFAFLALALPSVAVTLLVGSLYLGVPLNPSPILILVVPLAAVPLSGIGALIGATVRNMEEANSLSMILTFVLMGIGPVVIPPEQLPVWVVRLGMLSPATYASSALHQVLIGPITPHLSLDIAVLAALSVLVLVYVSRKMDWRASE